MRLPVTFHLFFLVTFACLTALAKGGVVINEIHHDPDVKTELAEFIELHNTGTEPVDLSGWEIGDAVVFTSVSYTHLTLPTILRV